MHHTGYITQPLSTMAGRSRLQHLSFVQHNLKTDINNRVYAEQPVSIPVKELKSYAAFIPVGKANDSSVDSCRRDLTPSLWFPQEKSRQCLKGQS